MLKNLILGFVVILSVAAQQISIEDIELEIPNLNETELEKPIYRFSPVVIREKVFAVAAFSKVNWFVAQQICSYRGMTLASINSALEGEQLRSHLIERGLTPEVFWLSGTNLGDINSWVWLSNGLPFVFRGWASGQPDNSGGNDRCLRLIPDGWDDIDCYAQHYFICENRCPLDSL